MTELDVLLFSCICASALLSIVVLDRESCGECCWSIVQRWVGLGSLLEVCKTDW